LIEEDDLSPFALTEEHPSYSHYMLSSGRLYRKSGVSIFLRRQHWNQESAW
jgi:hypothetical protein